MGKSLSSILSQIERLQKEAAAIQSEVVERIQKEIAKYSLTPEQLFGQPSGRSRSAEAAKPSKRAKSSKAPKTASAGAAKYADGAGNTWVGKGPRPQWLRQALEAGKILESFLVGSSEAAVTTPQPTTKKRAPNAKTARMPKATKPARKAAAPAKKRAATKKVTAKRAPAKAANAAAVES